MTDNLTPPAGYYWRALFNAKRAHVFRDGRSLCRRWLHLGREDPEDAQTFRAEPGRDDCRTCHAKILAIVRPPSPPARTAWAVFFVGVPSGRRNRRRIYQTAEVDGRMVTWTTDDPVDAHAYAEKLSGVCGTFRARRVRLDAAGNVIA